MSTATAREYPEPSSGPPRRPGRVRALYDRFEHLLSEVGKFGIVGAVAFFVDVGVFNFSLRTLAWNPLWSQVASVTVAATLAFVGNRFWTWRDRPRSSLRREYVLYFVFNAVGLLIGLACLWFSHYLLGAIWPRVFQSHLMDNISAKIVGTALGTIFRFWAYRRWVFVESQPDHAALAAGRDPPRTDGQEGSTP